MERSNILLFILGSFLIVCSTGAVECENGWHPFKDELYIKAFPNLLTYDEAKTFCISQGNEMSKSSMVIVKEVEMQELLVSSTADVYDNLWLGGRYDEETAQFKWEDGEPLTYTNWQEGSPRNYSDSNICIDFRPTNAKHMNTEGKWSDVNCNRRNLVICQRVLSWTLQDAISEIINMRKQLGDAADERNELLQRLENTEQDLWKRKKI